MALDKATTPEVIRFVNDELRPLAERIRNAKAVFDGFLGRWHGGGIGAVVGGEGIDEPVEDERDAEGVSRLTAGDLVNFVAQVEALDAVFEGGGVMDVVRKPTVRPLRIQAEV